MSTSTAELTLLINAQNLSNAAIGQFQGALNKVAVVAESTGNRIKGAFRSVSSGITNGLGNLTESLASGAGLGEAAFQFGAYMAGQAAESLVGHLIENLAGSAIVAAIGAPLAAAGSAIGGLIAAAIPIGMALLPALLVAAIVAAVIFLINNPEIVDKILDFAGGVVDFIIDGLVALPGMLLDFFGAAWQGVVDAVGPFIQAIVDFFIGIPGKLVDLGLNIVKTIIGGLISLPGKVADVVRNAFAKLKIDVGPFHITGHGITIDLPEINLNDANAGKGGKGNQVPGHASGGWVGLNGPELGWLGENGPEYVVPNHQLGGGAPVILQLMLDGEKVARIVDERLFYSLQRAAPTAGRV